MDTARALTENLAALLRREHGALAEFLVALSDFDERELWRALGYTSLFHFLVRELRLSKASAQYRKTAAELIRRVPAVADALREGRLCLTSVIEAAKVVTPANWETVLPRFYGLSRREAMEVSAALAPHPAPPQRTVITTSRVLSAAPCPALELTLAAPVAPATDAARGGSTVEPPGTTDAPARRPAEFVPLTATEDRLHVTTSKAFRRKLDAARDAHPNLTVEDLLEAGLDLLLEKAAKRKGIVAKPQQNPRPTNSDDHVPAHVKREVMKRDDGKCQWKLPSGERCGATRHLQFDHVVPRALGGTSTVENVRMLCRGHNLEAARQVFGDEVIDHYARPARNRIRRGA